MTPRGLELAIYTATAKLHGRLLKKKNPGVTYPDMATIVVDNREKEIIKQLERLKATFTIENLPLGDVIFKIADQEVYVLERKTKADLVASIVDNRYKDQKIRLIENYVKKGIPVVYLIEGFYKSGGHESVPHRNQLAALVNTSLRDDILVYHVDTTKDSIDYILELQKKLPQFQGDNKNLAEAEYVSSIQKKRGDNITPENMLIVMLCQIPKVGHNVAKSVAEKYNTMSNLCLSFEECEDEHRELMLSELKVGKRRIGKIISKQIYNFLHGKDPEDEKAVDIAQETGTAMETD